MCARSSPLLVCLDGNVAWPNRLTDPSGRKEITTFFYLYMLLTFCSLCLDSGVIPPGSSPYPYFAAVQAGLVSALCACLLVNGFVGFQLYEDGTTLSVWLLRGVSFAFFIITFLVSIMTFKAWGSLGPTHTVGLFVVLYIVNAICLAIYVAMQIILVVYTLHDRWPLGDIAFGAILFVVGQVILYVFSNSICMAVQHYLDGLFFTTICNLLAVMMVYKVGPSSCAFLNLPPVRLMNMVIYSTGIPSPEKILNFLLARNRTTGKSRSSFLMKTAEPPSTRTPSTQPACFSSLINGTQITGGSQHRVLASYRCRSERVICVIEGSSCNVVLRGVAIILLEGILWME